MRLTFVALACLAATVCRAEDPADAENPRLVEVIRRCAPAEVDISGVNVNPDGTQGGYVGCGILIHADGYILTNAHVVGSGNLTAHLQDGTAIKCRVVARHSSEDIALLKIDRKAPFPVIPLGTNKGLELGETAIVIGNPGGLSHTVSTGIVSRLPLGYVETGHIQVTAAVNGGNSGGPLLNGRGELLGVVTAKVNGEGMGLAIPVDRIRKLFQDMLLDEEARGWRLGFTVDTFGAEAVVSAVADGSPAAGALAKGDVLIKVGGVPVRDGIEACLRLGDAKPEARVELEVKRNGAISLLKLAPAAIPLRAAEPDGDFGNGVRFEVYKGNFVRVADIPKSAPASWGFAATVSASPTGAPETSVGLRFEAFISIPADGAWTFALDSDDGSCLWIGDRLIVDNDGPHGSVEKRGTIRLAKGRHALTVGYFQGAGPKSLKLLLGGPGMEKKEVGAEMLWVKK